MMHHSQRVITSIPLSELWDERGAVRAIRSRDLSADDIRQLLRRGPMRFVVAEVASPPRWISVADRFTFWKGEVQSHLAEPGLSASLDDFPGDSCYFASEWSPVAGASIVLLEKAH